MTVEPGRAGEYLERVRDEGASFYGEFGWRLVGAWETALRHDDEAFVLWSIPSWEAWGEAESRWRAGTSWRDRQRAAARDFNRILLVDAPLSPLRLGRQPARSDREEDYPEE